MTASLRPAADPAPGRESLRLVVVPTPQPPLEDERIPVRLVLPGVTVPRTGEWRRFDDVECSGWVRCRRHRVGGAEWSGLAGTGRHAMGRPAAPQNRILGLQLARSA